MKKYMMGGYGTQQQMPTAAKTPMLPTQASSMPMQAQRKPMTMMAKGGAVKAANCGASMKPAQKRK